MKLTDVYTAPEAAQILYELLRERSAEDDPFVNISHRRLPTLMEHVRFFHSKPYRLWALIEVESRYVGYMSITKRNEIGIVLFMAERGKGYGRQALQLLLAQHQPLPAIPSERSGHFLANINPLNARSIRLFGGLGFKLLQHTYQL